jgi:hypothetical protein
MAVSAHWLPFASGGSGMGVIHGGVAEFNVSRV